MTEACHGSDDDNDDGEDDVDADGDDNDNRICDAADFFSCRAGATCSLCCLQWCGDGS